MSNPDPAVEAVIDETVAHLDGIARKRAGKPLVPCGTTAAYARHYANGEKPCQACKDAFNTDRRKRSADAAPPQRRQPEAYVHGTTGGYKRHLKHREKPCAECLQANRDYQQDWQRRKGLELAGVPAAKPKVLVHWLIPRGATMDGAHLEYAVKLADEVNPCSMDEAEQFAVRGATILSRWATDWIDAQ